MYIPNISVAEIKTYTHTVKQRFGGSQSADDARVAAIARAKREVLEHAGTYLESLTIIKNHLVDKDEVQILAAGVLKTEVVSEKRYASEDAYGIIVTVKVDIDTKVLEKRISKLLQDRELLEKYRTAKKTEKKLLARIEKLEEQNQKLNSLPPQRREQKKEELEAQFNETAASLTAIDWVTKGIIAQLDGEDSKINIQAIDYFNKAIVLDPNCSDAYFWRGSFYLTASSEYQLAIDDFTRVVQIDPKYKDVYRYRGEAFRRVSKHDQALADFNLAISYNPKDAYAYSERGETYNSLGQYERAIKDFNQTLIIDPDNSHAYFRRGNAYKDLKKYNKAINSYNKAIKLFPSHIPYLGVRAHAFFCLAMEHSKNKAIKYAKLSINDHNRIFNIQKHDSELDVFSSFMNYFGRSSAYNYLAKNYDSIGKRLSAIKCYRHALIDSDKALSIGKTESFYRFLLPQAYIARGMALYGLKDYKQSFAALNKAISTEGIKSDNRLLAAFYLTRGYNSFKYGENLDTPVRAYPSLWGQSLFKEKNYDEAIILFNEAIELDPEDSFSYRYRAKCFTMLKQYENALNDFNKAIRLNPEDKEAYCFRGSIWSSVLGNHKKALVDYNKCIQMDPENPDAYYFRCGCNFKLKYYDEAIKDCNKAIELIPTVAHYYLARAQVYDELGNNELAINDLKVAARLGDKGAQKFLEYKGEHY